MLEMSLYVPFTKIRWVSWWVKKTFLQVLPYHLDLTLCVTPSSVKGHTQQCVGDHMWCQDSKHCGVKIHNVAATLHDRQLPLSLNNLFGPYIWALTKKSSHNTKWSLRFKEIKRITNKLNISKQYTLFNLHLVFPRNKWPYIGQLSSTCHSYLLHLSCSQRSVRTHILVQLTMHAETGALHQFKIAGIQPQPTFLAFKVLYKTIICKPASVFNFSVLLTHIYYYDEQYSQYIFPHLNLLTELLLAVLGGPNDWPRDSCVKGQVPYSLYYLPGPKVLKVVTKYFYSLIIKSLTLH